MVRQARSSLEERLRQRLMEIAVQLGQAKDKLNRAGAAVRVGEMAYDEYEKVVGTLRHQRERLERRRQNVRGWLAVGDPHMAGGYLDLPLENVPFGPVDFSFQGEPISEERELVDFLVSQLHDAFSRIEAAEARIGRWARAEGDVGPSDEEKAAILAEKERAQAAARFYRARLTRMGQDCENDIRAVKVHLEFGRNRFEAGELAKGDYQDLEMNLLRAQADNAKARDLANRAGSAVVLSEIPRSAGTFLDRFGKVPARQPVGADSWLIWIAALLLVGVMFLPVSAAQGSNAENVRGLTISVVMMAALFAIFGALPNRPLRGALITGLWILGTIGVTLYMSGQFHSTRPVGTAMRTDALWLLRPGLLLLVVSGILGAAAAAISLFPYRSLRLPVFVLIAGVIVCVGGVLTDFGGIFAPKPVLAVHPGALVNQAGQYETIVTVRNEGRRTLWLADAGSSFPNAATFLLELKIGRDSWRDMTIPDRLIADRHQYSRADLAGMPQLMLAPGGEARFIYHLPPGTYRTQIRLHVQDAEPLVQDFTLDEPPPSEVARDEVVDPETNAEEEIVPEPTPDTFATPIHLGRTVELRGVMNAPDTEPMFAIIIHQRDGSQDSVRVKLGQRVYAEWMATEFNPETQALTLSNGEQIEILRRGESVQLP
jgi:hypothetical protein